MAAEKKTTILIWASVAAAAAGIAVAAAFFKFRADDDSDTTEPGTDHRHLKQVLTDCYDKLHEIEDKLSV